ncbi:MAG: glycoside hydrolase family 43 protein [Anaerolineae bacterium]|nr:glycoside hydrolase family 43 protein [Anaerolineae bacterium]
MLTYTNPVYPHYFADPFVLKHDEHYYAYGTGPAGPNGERFPVLHSPNCVDWERLGWSLIPSGGTDFWAPEVAYVDGQFYMYFSAQGIDGKDHHLRVATSQAPTGPFWDTGKILVPDQPFSIDPHPFQDQDGQWYLFYARDFLTTDEEAHVGTGIVVSRLLDMTTLDNSPHIVVRPHADWHLFLPQRSMYGEVYDWYTVEGPSTLLHNNHYYCFYSGGAWERDNYGVACVVADSPLGPYLRPEYAQAPLLRTVPEQVIGPGHNSFTRSLDGSQTYMVYHAWDAARTARLMRIDPLHWEGDRPVIQGPTWTPQLLRGQGD